jgi:Ca-activated chloride channel homolog
VKNRVIVLAGVLLLVLLAGCSTAPSQPAHRAYENSRHRASTYKPADESGQDERSWVRDFAGAPADELWVIVPPERRLLPPNDETPGSGTMFTPTSTGFAALPLEMTTVEAHITSIFAGVEVLQEFRNPYAEKIEAVYAFPLPQDASVTGFVMTIGQRTIRAVVREREEAEALYYEARKAGKNAALLTQERPNIFTQKVANIEPGQNIDINITYFHTVNLADGWYEWVYPMTIGPRFRPPNATRRTTSPTLHPTPYLTATDSATPRVSINLTIDAGTTVHSLESPSHAISTTQQSPGKWLVNFADSSVAADRDFRVRYRVGGNGPQGSLALADAGPGTRGGYFALTITPPLNPSEMATRPLEMTFILDRSGSMKGKPFDQARAAIDYALGQLSPADTFQIVSFSNDVSRFSNAPVSASREAVRQGRAYLRSLRADGGTMVLQGINSAFAQRNDRQRTRVVVLLSDGLVSNEAEIIGRVHARADDVCVFSFGIGDAPNRFLMNRIARMGDGAATYIGAGDDPVEPMRLFLERVSTPALTDVRIDYGSLAVRDIVPDRIPDLWLGRPITIVGRTRSNPSDINTGTITVTGKVNGITRRIEIPIDPAVASSTDTLPYIWARRKIMQLVDEATFRSPGPRQREIRKLALNYGLASPFTAFVAVDALSQTSGTSGTTIIQPLPMPNGMRYETSVESSEDR